MCYMEPNCVSINLGPSQGGNYICKLNVAVKTPGIFCSVILGGRGGGKGMGLGSQIVQTKV